MRLKLFLVVLFSLAASCASAQLKWDVLEVSQTVTATVVEALASFPFKNSGDDSVTITEISSSCGCTTAELEKKTYAPGESGEIVAKFKIGSRYGLQTKTIQIKTDVEEAPTVLTMKTSIPKLVDLQPAYVAWARGEVPDMKTVSVTMGAAEPVHIIKVEAENPTVHVELEETEAGKTYLLNLFPESTDVAQKVRIKILTDYPRETPRTFYIFAHIK